MMPHLGLFLALAAAYLLVKPSSVGGTPGAGTGGYVPPPPVTGIGQSSAGMTSGLSSSGGGVVSSGSSSSCPGGSGIVCDPVNGCVQQCITD